MKRRGGHNTPHTEEAKRRISVAVNAHHEAQGYRANGGFKRCRSCDVSLPVEMFCKHSRKKDGLRANCRQCESSKFCQWYSENLEAQRERGRSNATRRRSDGRARAYEDANKDYLTEVRREWQRRNKDRVRAYAQRRISTLSNATVANYLRLPVDMVPQSLIEAKRLHVQIQRLLMKEKQE